MKKQYKQQLTPRSPVQVRDKQKVKVVLRIRPFEDNQQQQQFLTVQDEKTVCVNKPGYPSYMKFNYVQAQNPTKSTKQASQQNIFNSVKQAIECIFQGVDSTIFAYGQTGAGKTYTIIGNCPEVNSQSDYFKVSLLTNERGILPRALQRVFQEQSSKRDSRITISFFEIYNEKIFDLLNSTLKPLEIRQLKSGELSIPGLQFIEVVSMKEVINYLALGIQNRVTSSTQANIKSSRSHSIFHLKYQRLVINEQTGDHQVLAANLRVVDLAGSQKFNVPQDIPQSQKQIKLLQLKSINGSLSKLGHCISALTAQSRSHIPFRDSKLTRILSDSLLGSGKIRLIICASPSITSTNETSSTLQFADRVKKAIFERPTLSIQKKKTIDMEQYKQIEKQLQMQRNKRIQLQAILTDFLKGKNMQQQDLIKQNFKLRQQVSFLKQQIKIYVGQAKIVQPSSNRYMQGSRNKISPMNIKNIPNQGASIRKSPLNSKGSHLRSSQNQNSSISMARQGMKGKNLYNQKKVSTHKYIKTPPKTSTTQSVHDFQSQQRRSFDGSVSPNHMKKIPNKVIPTKRVQHFQSKIKRFMENTDVDKDLQQKVRKRLNQIKKQLVQNQSQPTQGPWFANDVQKLWKR